MAFGGLLGAQGLTGQIGGTIVDDSKGVLPGATVTVTNQNTSATASVTTDGNGAFVITNLLAGPYELTVSLDGFKLYRRPGLVLTATERLSMPPITLEVGGLSELVSVIAESPMIQTQSGERSAVITIQQLEDRGLKGRDPFGTLNVLPGVIDTRNRDAPAAGNVGGLSINGQTSVHFSYDGVTSKDTGSNSNNFAAPALDSIAEIKVQTSNFQAEYGRSSGATIVAVTKSGSRDFHGSLAYFRRDDKFNANSWERITQCAAGQLSSCNKPPYDYNNTTYTLGGPVLLPGRLGHFNERRNKLFFFWSQDLLPKTDPNTLTQVTMPTALERNGDFSQTFDTQGRLIYIRDPLSGQLCNVVTGGAGCFAGNRIPAERIDPLGQKILTLLPLPNSPDPSGLRQFNYRYQNVLERPRNDQVLRIDSNVAQGTTFYSRLQFGHEIVQRGLSASLGSSNNGGWPQFHTSRENNTVGLVNTLLHSFSTTTVMEVTAGVNWAKQSTLIVDEQSLAQNQRANVLPGLRQFFPESNPLNLIPNMSFAGTNALPNRASFNIEQRFPFTARDDIFNISTNLTKVAGPHIMKVGIFVEHTNRPASRSSAFNGTIAFDGDVSNPFDTNFGFANALIGSVQTYTEANQHPYAQGRYNQVEFFAQDNWRLADRVTLDYGMRFYYIGPTYVSGQQVAIFDPTQYDPTKAPLQYELACANNAATCTGTNRRARNPLTGELLNNTFIGKIVPGTGNPNNGLVVKDSTALGGAFLPAPRIGFAWDPTGSSKTSIRGGAGVFYDRYSDDVILQLIEGPPLMDTRTTSYTTLPQLLSSQLVAGTNPTMFAFNDKFRPPTVYNWSIGVQRELPWKLASDIAYVGNAGRHTATTTTLNSVPYGTQRVDLNPQNADPSQNNTQPKPLDYLRRYRGFSTITARTWNGYNNYHSIQVSLNRRFSNGFGWSAAYTGAIRSSLTTFDANLSAEENKVRNYGMDSRPHNLVISYNYSVPSLSKRWNNLLTKALLDNWQLSGVSVFQSGPHQGFTVTFTGAPLTDMTGIGNTGNNITSRVTLLCDPNLPRGERTADRQFKTECIGPPGPRGTAQDIYYLGNAVNDEYIGLGYMNHDLSFFKNVPLGGTRRLQFRVELYNVFNSTQFGTVDRAARFDFNTGAQLNPNLGHVTASRNGSNRIIQLGARLQF
ncbi:MAG: carboxypeptidase regulatory-like domain-containing protein [Vicinamibacterales bacterium]